MQSLIIVKPLRPVAIIGTQTLARALTPDPKEAAYVPKPATSITLDYGVPVTVDTAFVGYHTAMSGQEWAVVATTSDGLQLVDRLTPIIPLQSLGMGPPYHGFYRSVKPVTSRYWQFQFNDGPNHIDYLIGTIALGLSWQAQWGTEWGAGRLIEDTGSADRLFGGGFAIDDGVAAGGYQWVFGDLQPEEVRQLYQLVKDRRTTRSVLVVEDPEQTDGLNERIHWGLFGKLDTYERLDPMNTKWSLSVRDWA